MRARRRRGTAPAICSGDEVLQGGDPVWCTRGRAARCVEVCTVLVRTSPGMGAACFLGSGADLEKRQVLAARREAAVLGGDGISYNLRVFV